MTIRIYIGKPKYRDNRPPQFPVTLHSPDGEYLGAWADPCFSAARVLLDKGTPGTEYLEMWDDTTPYCRYSGVIANLAKYTVEEGSKIPLKKVKWREYGRGKEEE